MPGLLRTQNIFASKAKEKTQPRHGKTFPAPQGVCARFFRSRACRPPARSTPPRRFRSVNLLHAAAAAPFARRGRRARQGLRFAVRRRILRSAISRCCGPGRSAAAYCRAAFWSIRRSQAASRAEISSQTRPKLAPMPGRYWLRQAEISPKAGPKSAPRPRFGVLCPRMVGTAHRDTLASTLPISSHDRVGCCRFRCIGVKTRKGRADRMRGGGGRLFGCGPGFRLCLTSTALFIHDALSQVQQANFIHQIVGMQQPRWWAQLRSGHSHDLM